MFGSLSGLYLIDANIAFLFPSRDNQKCLQTLWNLQPGDRISLIENHCPRPVDPTHLFPKQSKSQPHTLHFKQSVGPRMQMLSCNSVTTASFASKDCGFHLLWGRSYVQERKSCYKLLFTWEVAVRIIVRERTLERGRSGDFSLRKDCSKRRGILASVMWLEGHPNIHVNKRIIPF